MVDKNALITVDATPLATMKDTPTAVLDEAKSAAVALQGVIKAKPKPVIMNGEQYLEFEDWQTLGRFYSITAGEETEPEFVNLDGVKGFKATSVALMHGQIISRATAYCMNDEEKWGARPKYEYLMALKDGGTAREEASEKSDWVWEENLRKPGSKKPKRVRVLTGSEPVPLYQLASMAQTRANAKVLRNVLSWVAVLAGYKPTPAEEMSEVSRTPNAAPRQSEREPGSDDGPPSAAQECKFCGSVAVDISANGKSAQCTDCSKGWNLGR